MGPSSSPTMSTLERFQRLEPGEFRQEVERLWNAGEKVIDTVADQVEEGNISPIQGLGIIGCTTSQLYAYAAFHGEPSQVDLVSALSDRALTSSH